VNGYSAKPIKPLSEDTLDSLKLGNTNNNNSGINLNGNISSNSNTNNGIGIKYPE
jgi:hypothetical protein